MTVSPAKKGEPMEMPVDV